MLRIPEIGKINSSRHEVWRPIVGMFCQDPNLARSRVVLLGNGLEPLEKLSSENRGSVSRDSKVAFLKIVARLETVGFFVLF